MIILSIISTKPLCYIEDNKLLQCHILINNENKFPGDNALTGNSGSD